MRNKDIWYLAYEGDERINQLPDTTKPFTEEDFHKYFDKLFSRRFINAIQKIKSEELHKNGTFGTAEFQEDKDATYRMEGTFNKEECSLELNLFSNTVKVQDNGEGSIIYEFTVKNGEIKLIGVWLAG